MKETNQNYQNNQNNNNNNQINIPSGLVLEKIEYEETNQNNQNFKILIKNLYL